MNKTLSMNSLALLVFAMVTSCTKQDEIPEINDEPTSNTRATISYTMPDENQMHEGTWLQWPHHYTYGTSYRNRLDPTWVQMTKELVSSEKVHIIAYNTTEKNRITTLLNNAAVPLGNIDLPCPC